MMKLQDVATVESEVESCSSPAKNSEKTNSLPAVTGQNSPSDATPPSPPQPRLSDLSVGGIISSFFFY